MVLCLLGSPLPIALTPATRNIEAFNVSCDIHVLVLDPLEDGPRVIVRDCPASALLWID